MLSGGAAMVIDFGIAKPLTESQNLRWFLNWDCPWVKAVKDDPRYGDLKRRVLATTFKS